MKTLELKFRLIPLIMIWLLVGCSPDQAKNQLPEVTAENCADTEMIKKIEDKKAREEFSSLCLRRGGFVKSPARQW